MRVCATCGEENERTAQSCRSCGELFDEEETIAVSRRTKPSDEPEFGFHPTEIDLLNQGIGVNAANRLVERFQPILHINTGGMGKLFMVQERLSGRYVALKVMHERAVRDKSLVDQFVREAVITARLQHPHIIPVHELGFIERGQLYYTMRYVDGNPLSDVLNDIEIEDGLRILRSAALAVDFAHSQGFWHRDLKPQNILVGQLGDPYVIDWGLVTVQRGKDYKLNLPKIVVEKAAIHLPDNLFEETRDAATARAGIIVGTPPYMSPEQCMGDDDSMGSVSDIWAFGVMLFEVLTGRHPIKDWKCLGHRPTMEHIVTHNMPSPKDIVSDTPDVLNELCQRMLKREPKERMQSLKDFIGEITYYLKAQGKTILTLETFPRSLTNTIPRYNVANTRAEELQREVSELRNENSYLRADSERSKKKIEILTEMNQLNWMEGRRKKELWRELARL